MTDPTTRELIADLLATIKSLAPNGRGLLIAKAEALLSQPEPEGPTDEELLATAAASIEPCQDTGIAFGEYELETEGAVEMYGSELIAFARAVLARWGK